MRLARTGASCGVRELAPAVCRSGSPERAATIRPMRDPQRVILSRGQSKLGAIQPIPWQQRHCAVILGEVRRLFSSSVALVATDAGRRSRKTSLRYTARPCSQHEPHTWYSRPPTRCRTPTAPKTPHHTVDDFSLHQQPLASAHTLISKYSLYPRTPPTCAISDDHLKPRPKHVQGRARLPAHVHRNPLLVRHGVRADNRRSLPHVAK